MTDNLNTVCILLSSSFIFFKEVRMQVIGTVTTCSRFTRSLKQKAFLKAFMSVMVRDFRGSVQRQRNRDLSWHRLLGANFGFMPEWDRKVSLYHILKSSQWRAHIWVTLGWIEKVFLSCPMHWQCYEAGQTAWTHSCARPLCWVELTESFSKHYSSYAEVLWSINIFKLQRR